MNRGNGARVRRRVALERDVVPDGELHASFLLEAAAHRGVPYLARGVEHAPHTPRALEHGAARVVHHPSASSSRIASYHFRPPSPLRARTSASRWFFTSCSGRRPSAFRASCSLSP